MNSRVTQFAVVFCLFAPAAFAGYKVTLTTELKGAPQRTVIASMLNSGDVASLTPAMAHIETSGHYEIRLKAANRRSATVEVWVWDRTGLGMNSPRFRSHFSVSRKFRRGQAELIRFTQGDASVPSGSTEHQLGVRLDRIEPCDDNTNCLTR